MENQSQADSMPLVIAIPAGQTDLATDHHEDHVNAATPVGVTPAASPSAIVAKKKRGGNQIVQAAMVLLRRHARKPSKPAAVKGVAPKSPWNRLLGSMRPLHLQSNPTSPPPIFEINAPSTQTESEGGYEDGIPPPLSPLVHAAGDDMSRSSSTASMPTPYASAVNLQELDRTKHGEDKNKGKSAMHTRYASAPNLQELDQSEDDGGKNKGMAQCASALNLQDLEDEQIDARAEEFIAQFYQQMKLQGSD